MTDDCLLLLCFARLAYLRHNLKIKTCPIFSFKPEPAETAHQQYLFLLRTAQNIRFYGRIKSLAFLTQQLIIFIYLPRFFQHHMDTLIGHKSYSFQISSLKKNSAKPPQKNTYLTILLICQFSCSAGAQEPAVPCRVPGTVIFNLIKTFYTGK